MIPKFGLALAPFLLVAAPDGAAAQPLDCANAVTQIEMTGCAAQDYEASDDVLNDSYAQAMARARQMDDAYVPEGVPPRAELLRTAQRAWLTYRDAACDTEAALFYGGSMASQSFYICLERLTRRRTEDLDAFAETN